MWRSVLDLLAPIRCLACGRRGDQPWCPPCAPVPLDVGRTCPQCGAEVRTPVSRGGGRSCPLADVPIDGLVAAYDYRGVAGTVVRAAKLSGYTSAYPVLGQRLAEAVAARQWPVPDVVTAVPVPARRRRRRGFDHAARLAAAVAAALGRPVAALLVAGATTVDRGAAGRDSDGVAAMVARGRVPRDVLLVDDVVTTGATVRVAVAALRRAGAGRVWVATVARAGGHGRQRRLAGHGR